MKKLFTIAIAVLFSLPLFADLNTMNYQAVINTPDGTPAADKTIGVKFSIASGTDILFTEEATVTTTTAGLLEWQIGSSSEYGLSNIDWTADNLTLQVGIDLNGGTDYTSIYSSSIQSVPTALYASHSGDSIFLLEHIDQLRDETYYLIDQNTKELYEMAMRLEEKTCEYEARIYELEIRENESLNYIQTLLNVTNEQQYQIEELRAIVSMLQAEIEELKANN